MRQECKQIIGVPHVLVVVSGDVPEAMIITVLLGKPKVTKLARPWAYK